MASCNCMGPQNGAPLCPCRMAAFESGATKRAIMKRANYLPAPHYFRLNHACMVINAAFDGYGCYLVGSSLDRRDWRDVDVRYIMKDEEYARLFPGLKGNPRVNALWSLITTTTSEWLSKSCDLPIDFQIQMQSEANAEFSSKDGHPRSFLGMFVGRHEP